MAPRNLDGSRAQESLVSDTALSDRLGFSVSPLSMAETVAAIREFIGSESPHLVVTADAASAVLARRDTLYADIIKRADLVTPDGFGIVWACRFLGRKLPDRICGVDLVPEIAKCCAYEKKSLFLLGGKPGVAEGAASELKRRYPALEIAGCHDGYFDGDREAAVVETIARAQPDVVVAAMGAPKQEKWLAENTGKIGAKLGIGVGGSLDVLAGKAKRAPRWMQRVGLEWLWRVVRDPKKAKKVAMLPAFVWLVVTARLGPRSGDMRAGRG